MSVSSRVMLFLLYKKFQSPVNFVLLCVTFSSLYPKSLARHVVGVIRATIIDKWIIIC